MSKIELERKWLVKDIGRLQDDDNTSGVIIIYQKYLCNNPEVRIRREICYGIGTHYTICKKEKVNNSYTERRETEEVISETTFGILDNLPGKVIKKVRTLIYDKKFRYELDEYLNRDLTILEVEFKNKEDMDSINLDKFEGIFIPIEDDSYCNSKLAK